MNTNLMQKANDMKNNLMQIANNSDLTPNEGAQTPLDVFTGAKDMILNIKDTIEFGGKTLDVSEERDKRFDENYRAAIECHDKLADRPDLSDEQMRQITEGIAKVLTVQNEDAEAGRAHQRSILRTVLGGALAIGALAIGGPALMKNVALGLI